MKATLGSINTLKSFETWNDHFVIIPPRRFVVFGEGKQASLRGVAVEGYLNEEFQDCNAYSFRDLFSGNFKPSTTKFNPIRKIDFFDQLIGAPAITHFTLGSDELKLLRKIDARKFTHIRFYKKPTGVTTARAFNVCKYFASAVSTSEINDYPNWEDLPQNLDEFSETQIGSAYQDNWEDDTAESFEVPLKQLATENDQYSLDELDEIMEELISQSEGKDTEGYEEWDDED